MYFPDDDDEATPARRGGRKRVRSAASDDDDDALEAAAMVVEAIHFKQPRLMPDAVLCELLDLSPEILTVIAGFLGTDFCALRNLAATQHFLADIVSSVLADAYVKATKEVRKLQQSDAFDFWTNDTPVMVRMRECSAVRRAVVNSGVANQSVWAYAAAERGVTTEHLFARATATLPLYWKSPPNPKRDGNLVYDFVQVQHRYRQIQSGRFENEDGALGRHLVAEEELLRDSSDYYWPSFALSDVDIAPADFDLPAQIDRAWFPGFKAMVEEVLPGAHAWPYELLYNVLGRFPAVANYLSNNAGYTSSNKLRRLHWVGLFLSEWVQDNTEDFISAMAQSEASCAPSLFLYAVLRMVALRGWPDASISFDSKFQQLKDAFNFRVFDFSWGRPTNAGSTCPMQFLSRALWHFYFGEPGRGNTGAFFFTADDDKAPRLRFTNTNEMWSALDNAARARLEEKNEPRTLLAFFQRLDTIRPDGFNTLLTERMCLRVLPLLHRIEEARAAAATAAAGHY